MNNIILIGMPGCGKSTCGVILAKALGMDFIDTDLLIQNKEKMKLQEIIVNKGNDYFADCEEKTICECSFNNCVIATGASVVYSEKAMKHLSFDGVILYINISFETMIKRIGNMKTRGILLRDGENIIEMYEHRKKLYAQYADVTVSCNDNDIEATVQEIIELLNLNN